MGRRPHYRAPEVMTEITINIPAPPPINQTRRIDWAKHAKHMAWRKRAGGSILEFMSNARKAGTPNHIAGQFEIAITLDEKTVNCDLDATLKGTVDFLVVSGIVTDDSKKYMRRVVLEWGDCPEGCRVMLRSI